MMSSIFNMAAMGGMAMGTLVIGARSLYSIREKQEGLVTSFGKLVRTNKEAGLHFKAPWQAVSKVNTDLQQETETLETKTKDDLFVKLPIAIQYEITDTEKYLFANRDSVSTMKKSVSQAVRTATAGKDFQELYNDRDDISNAVIDHIKAEVDEFGINIRRVIIDEPTAPQEVQNAFNEVRASERLREAAKNKADAYKIEIVAKAEAEKEADILRGQGKAGFRKEIFEQYSEQISKLEEAGVTRTEAVDVMMRAMQQDTLRDIGENGNLVIVTDGEASGGTGRNIAEMQTLARMFEKNSAQNNPAPAQTSPAAPQEKISAAQDNLPPAQQAPAPHMGMGMK